MRIQADPYPVYSESHGFTHLREFLQAGGYHPVVVLADDHTARHCLPVLQDALAGVVSLHPVAVPPGEPSKSLYSAEQIWHFMLDLQASRKTLLINLGGGMITDLGGFSAALYKRGVDFVHIPTSLLAQVDAAIGGKTAVNVGAHKNMIGTFTMPRAVFIYPGFLRTLPGAEYRSGMAEVLKHALIADAHYWQSLTTASAAGEEAMISRSVAIKTEIILRDPHETGERKKLNFGHTIGHAIEAWSLHTGKPVLHGTAVAAGMLAEAWLSQQRAGLSASALQEITDALKPFDPVLFSAADIPEILGYMRNDKKNAGDEIRFVLLTAIGNCAIDHAVPDRLIIEALHYYLTAVCDR